MRGSRRRRLRLALRDGAALAAFASMGISGEVPVPLVGAFVLGVALALLDLRILSRIAVASGIAVAGAAVLLCARVAYGGMDPVVAACTFAAVITLHRILSAPTPRTDHQVLLTSLLMISGGAALSGELLFAAMLALFTPCAFGALALGVVERTAPAGAEVDAAPLLGRVGLGALIALAGAVVFFALIPRLAWNVAGRRFPRGLGAISGLADGVRLGAGPGSIKTNPRLVARVQITPDPKQPMLRRYWLAHAYGTWTGREWRDEGRAQPPAELVELREGARRVVHQRVEILPAYGSRTAIALVDPVVFGNAVGFRDGARLRVDFSLVPDVEVRLADPADAYTYHVYSANVDETRAGVHLPDANLAKYVALPPLDARIARLAREIIQGELDPLRAARKLERYLGAHYRYTLDLPESAADPLSEFLFERKEGHCEYFATALAVMLRTQGFPARVATGFFGGERAGHAYLLRAGDAHAWTQVWLPGRGFVDVDATPEAGRAAQTAPVLAWLVRHYEVVDAWWRGSVLDYSIGDQVRLVKQVVKRSERSRNAPPAPRTGWIAAGVVALAVYCVWRVWLLLRGRIVSLEATRLRDQAEAVLSRAGLSPASGEGFEDFTTRIAPARPEIAHALAPLARRYLEARFGDRPLRAGERVELMLSLRVALKRGSRRQVA
jgi:transglutaminase-like putative cysteine protease